MPSLVTSNYSSLTMLLILSSTLFIAISILLISISILSSISTYLLFSLLIYHCPSLLLYIIYASDLFNSVTQQSVVSSDHNLSTSISSF